MPWKIQPDEADSGVTVAAALPIVFPEMPTAALGYRTKVNKAAEKFIGLLKSAMNILRVVGEKVKITSTCKGTATEGIVSLAVPATQKLSLEVYGNPFVKPGFVKV